MAGIPVMHIRLCSRSSQLGLLMARSKHWQGLVYTFTATSNRLSSCCIPIPCLHIPQKSSSHMTSEAPARSNWGVHLSCTRWTDTSNAPQQLARVENLQMAACAALRGAAATVARRTSQLPRSSPSLYVLVSMSDKSDLTSLILTTYHCCAKQASIHPSSAKRTGDYGQVGILPGSGSAGQPSGVWT